MAFRSPTPSRATRRVLVAAAAVALAALMVLPAGSLGNGGGARSAPSSRSGDVSPSSGSLGQDRVPTPTAAALASDLSSPSAGSLLQTAFLNYNGTEMGNFPFSVQDWTAGTPAYVPSTHSLWIPMRAVSANGTPLAEFAPAVVYNATTNQFATIVPSIQDSAAFLYDTDNGLLYSADYANDTVGVINVSTGAWVQPALHVGTDPVALAFDPVTDHIFVANEGSDNVTIINGDNNTVWNRGVAVGTGTKPRALAYDGNNHVLFIADGGDSYLRTIDTLSNSSGGSAPLTGSSTGVAYSAEAGTVAVTIASTAHLDIFDASSLAPVALPTIGIGATPVEINSTGTSFVIGDANGSNLVVVNSTTGEVIDNHIPVGQNVTVLASDAEGAEIFAWSIFDRNVSTVSLTSFEPVRSSPTLGPEPESLAYDPSTNRLFVANAFGGSVLVLNATTGLAAGKSIRPESAALSVTVDPTTDRLYVGANNTVVEFYASNGTLFVSQSLTGRNSPLLVDESDGLLWVDNQNLGYVALDLGSLGIVHESLAPTGLSIQQDSAALVSSVDGLFVVNESAHDVEEISTSTGQVIEEGIAAGSGTTSIAYDPADGYLYAAGTNVTVIDPSTGLVVGPPIAIISHVLLTGIAYDPSRADLYITTITNSSSESGAITVLDGSTLSASYGSQVVIAVGELPLDPLPLYVNGSGPYATTVIWVANLLSGTLSEITSPPQISFFAASPDRIDLGQSSQLLLGYSGGSGSETVTFSGLPPGCDSVSASALNCTPTAPGSYSITATVTDTYALETSASATLTVASGLSVALTIESGSGTSLDVGQTLVAEASATGGSAGYTYSWEFGDGATAVGSSASHSYSVAGTYLVNVTATDADREAASAYAVVHVEPLPTVTVTVMPVPTTDVDIPLDFIATITGGTTPGTGNWTFGDGATAAGTSAAHAWTSQGTYSVTFHYRDASGGFANQSLSVTVNPSLSATFSAGTPGATSSPSPGVSVPFVATIGGGTAPFNVTWQFGDGTESFGTSVHHAYARAGRYAVNVTLVDAGGGRLSSSFPFNVSTIGSSSSSSGTNPNFDVGIFLGIVAGATLAMVVLYLAGRSRRPPRPAPLRDAERMPDHPPEWKED